MTQLIVLSLLGSDRPGIVDEMTKVILECGGNIDESRMTALGKEFAMLLLVSGNWHTLNKLEASLDKLAADNDLTITLKSASMNPALCSTSPTFSHRAKSRFPNS